MVRQLWDGNTLAIMYDVSGNPYCCIYNGTMYFYVLNLQGDVIRLVTMDGSTAAEYQYDAWGNLLTPESSLSTIGKVNPIRYRGYYYDTETGFYYLQSRYYDSSIGRFINADSFASTGQSFLGYNMFAYCGNNPVNRSDSKGTAWEHWALAVGLVTIAAVGVVFTAGGVAAAAIAVASVVNGIAVSSTATTVAAGIFIGTSYGLAASTYSAMLESDSAEEFASYGESGLISTTLGGALGGINAYGLNGHTCFVAETQVKAADGNVAIEEIQAGDMVWAWDEETGEVALKEVVETYVSETNELVHVFVNGEEIITTPGHPFYSLGKGWTDAFNLQTGDILILVNGEYVVIEKVQCEILETPVMVYNFHVEDYHTYYVTDIGVLVHNSCKPTSPVKVKDSALRGVDVHAFKEEFVGRNVAHWDVFKDTANNSALWLGNKAQTVWHETGYFIEELFTIFPK